MKTAVTRYCWDLTGGKFYPTIIEALVDKPECAPVLMRVMVLEDDPPRIVHSVALDKEAWS